MGLFNQNFNASTGFYVYDLRLNTINNEITTL